jgi:MerR family transcriptional regulator, light-induced transcriptional regulator
MADDVSGARGGQHRKPAKGSVEVADTPLRPVPVLSWPVGAVADRLGVSTSTLRSWERRYGLGPTHRTGGNHRRYGPVDLQRVQLMARLTAAGIPAQSAAQNIRTMSAQEVARRLGATARGAASGRPDRGHGDALNDLDGLDGPDDLDGLDGPDDPHDLDGPDGGPHGRGIEDAEGFESVGSVFGRVAAPPGDRRTTDEGTVAAILSAARELDATGLVHLYRQTLRRLDLADAWSGVFAPSLRAIGERWGEGTMGIESEHLASELLQGELRGVVRANRFRVSGTPVLLGSADDEQHHLPLLAVEAELARHGVASLLLGPRVPVRALAKALDRARPPAVFIWASLRRLPTEPLWDLVEGLDWPLTVVIGGPGWPPEVVGTRGRATVVHATDLGSAVGHIVPVAGA